MDQLADAGSSQRPARPAWSSLAWIGGFVATLAAAALAAVLALFFAATVVVIGLLSAALVGVAALAFRARKAMRPRDPTLIEAQNIGGHSWVAYGWDQRSR